MKEYSEQAGVRLVTQMSLGQNSLNSQGELFDLRRTLTNIQTQTISKVAIRYWFHRFIQCLLISYVAFVIYITLIITTGTLIVYFTTPEKRGTLLLLAF